MLATTPATIVPDAILTEFYAEYKGNIGRLDRAIQLVEAGHVEQSNFPGLWLVRSATTPNGSYRVANGCCNCPDAARVGAQNCKHAISVRIFRAVERAEAEQSDPTPAPDDDTYYCVLCEEPIPAAEVVETRWGFMHERCAASEPRETDEDARYELTGRAYLALVPTAALPAPIGTIRRVPVVLSARAAQAASELYEDYPQGAAYGGVMATAMLMVQDQATHRVTKAEQRFAAAITALETFFEQHGNCGSPLAQQQLEREYRASQRALRAARTFYCTLANQYGWTLP